MKILERRFRGSVMCRTLGYPITYSIAKLLLEKGPMELGDVTRRVGRTKPTVCGHLAKLRMANLVRFEKTGFKTYYWVKYVKETRRCLEACERLAKRTTQKIDQDY
jgi:DNA-binding transcriptional ArsR family regulator